jgi:hypothetical protein
MDPTLKTSKNIEDIVLKADDYLQNINPTPFSAPAFSIIKGKISQYVQDLYNESIKISNHDQSDSVSVKHVELAAEHLKLQTPRRIYKHFGTIGGIFLGASLSNLLSMMTASQFSFLAISITVLLAIAGASLISFNIAKD